MIGELCIIGYVILAIIIVVIMYKLICWLYVRVYHMRHPELPKLKRKLLKGAYIQKYGKKEGKKLFKNTKFELFKRFKIR